MEALTKVCLIINIAFCFCNEMATDTERSSSFSLDRFHSSQFGTYVGCYSVDCVEISTNVSLPIGSLDMCNIICQVKQFPIAAVHNEKSCYCSCYQTWNNCDNQGDKCGVPCADIHKRCGGMGFMSVYKVKYLTGINDHCGDSHATTRSTTESIETPIPTSNYNLCDRSQQTIIWILATLIILIILLGVYRRIKPVHASCKRFPSFLHRADSTGQRQDSHEEPSSCPASNTNVAKLPRTSQENSCLYATPYADRDGGRQGSGGSYNSGGGSHNSGVVVGGTSCQHECGADDGYLTAEARVVQGPDDDNEPTYFVLEPTRD